MRASYNGHIETVKELINRGADINVKIYKKIINKENQY